jgi:hypothetical protein
VLYITASLLGALAISDYGYIAYSYARFTALVALALLATPSTGLLSTFTYDYDTSSIFAPESELWMTNFCPSAAFILITKSYVALSSCSSDNFADKALVLSCKYKTFYK